MGLFGRAEWERHRSGKVVRVIMRVTLNSTDWLLESEVRFKRT